MKIAIVRHGASVDGEQQIHQSTNTPLSKVGILQAKELANLLSRGSFRQIWSSKQLRSEQTADIIAQALSLEPRYVNELHEWRRPVEIIGRSRNDQEVKWIKQIMREHYTNPQWHFSDEENFHEVVERAHCVLKKFTDDDDDKIVVTHARFLSVLFWLMASNHPVSADDYIQKQHALYLDLGCMQIALFKDGSWIL